MLKEASDYTEMAQLAIEQGNPGEAQHILEKGFQKNVFTDARAKDKNTRLLESAKKAAQNDLASLPRVEKDAESQHDRRQERRCGTRVPGLPAVRQGHRPAQQGRDQGQACRNEAEARLLLGIAQLKSGKKDDAMKTFKAVKGDPNLERLAELWSLHARQA